MALEQLDFRDFVYWERESNDTIDYKKIYVDMVGGDVPTGLMLSQLIFWRLPAKNKDANHTKLTITRENRKWLAKSDSDWYAETRLTPKQAARCRGILEAQGLISVEKWKFGGAPMVHISINEEAFMARFHEILAIPIEVRDAGPIGSKPRTQQPKRPGSKPNSGNWKKPGEDDETSDNTTEPETENHDEIGYYPKGKMEITERVISKLPKGQYGNYPNGNMEITERAKTYTESTPEIPAETSSERTVVVEEPGTSTATAQAPEAGDHQRQHNNNFSQAEPETAQPPVGGSADADITDEDLELLFGSGTDSQAKVEDTAVENVPAAPAAPEAALPATPFVPTPESNLEVGKLLAAKLGGKARLTAMLSEPGRDNIRQKASWLDLEPARVQAILADAQAKCQGEGVTFITAITRRLDMALGARDLTKAPVAPGASTTPGTLGKAYEVAPSVVVAKLTGQPLNAEPQEAPRKFVPGAAWQDQGGRTVTIEALDGGRYRLSDGTLIVAHELMKHYTFAGAGA